MRIFTAVLVGTLIAVPVWASESYTVEAVKQPNQSWNFQRLMVSDKDQGEGVLVHGRLTANTAFALPKGHIDIAAYSPKGDLLVETTTSYSPSLLTYRTKRRGGLHFSSELPGRIPAGSVVKVAFHRDEPHGDTLPTHKLTLAK